eukprot:8230844-Pyramimonas_sp.AAC.1
MVEAAQRRTHLECLPGGREALHLPRVAHADPGQPAEHTSQSGPYQVAHNDCAVPASLAVQ